MLILFCLLWFCCLALLKKATGKENRIDEAEKPFWQQAQNYCNYYFPLVPNSAAAAAAEAVAKKQTHTNSLTHTHY